MGLRERLDENPVIAAVMTPEKLEEALRSPCEVVFLLAGNICTIGEAVRRVRQTGKGVYLHIDLMDGFGRDKYAIRYIKEHIAPSGIITTKAGLVKIAKELRLPAIQRMFLLDNLSLQTGIQSIRQTAPDAVEVMPGIMPAVTRKICAAVSTPVICGGLVNEKEDIIGSLSAGAVGVSTSNTGLWSS